MLLPRILLYEPCLSKSQRLFAFPAKMPKRAKKRCGKHKKKETTVLLAEVPPPSLAATLRDGQNILDKLVHLAKLFLHAHASKGMMHDAAVERRLRI